MGDTNEKTHGSDDYPSETDGCAINLAEEYENEEDVEFSENTSEINDSNKSKISEVITEEDVIISLLDKLFSLRLIQAVIFFIDTYEQVVLSVGNENKKNPVKGIWNHFNHIPMLSLLGGNHRLPLFNMAKGFSWMN